MLRKHGPDVFQAIYTYFSAYMLKKAAPHIICNPVTLTVNDTYTHLQSV